MSNPNWPDSSHVSLNQTLSSIKDVGYLIQSELLVEKRAGSVPKNHSTEKLMVLLGKQKGERDNRNRNISVFVML